MRLLHLCRRFAPHCAASLLAIVSTLVVGCTTSEPFEDTERTPVTFDVPRGGFPEFLATPFPSDLLRRERDGQQLLDLRAFPNPGASGALDEYLNLIQTTPGWSTIGAMYFHVEEGIDVATLPQTPAASLLDDSSVFLVEVDNPSVRIPIQWEYTEEATRFLPAGSLSVLPMLGTRLRGKAALVVTSDAHAESGVALGPSEDLRALVTCAPLRDADAVSVDANCEDYETLAGALGLDVNDVALLQIFTPQDPSSTLLAAANELKTRAVPTIEDLHLVEDADYTEYEVYRGTVFLEQFQRGTPPYDSFDGQTGALQIDDDNTLVTQRVEPIEFTLTIPRRPAPPAGWPVVVYGHGTGGDNGSTLGEGPRNEAHQLARAGWAVLAIAEPLHRGRAGYVSGAEDLYTFNLLNPVAGRDNWRQSALEKVQLVSLAQALEVPAGVSSTGSTIAIDGTQIGYMGHSQGSIVGAVFTGLEDRVVGVFLSGVGAGFAPSLVDKVEPVSILDIFRTVLQLPDDEPVGLFHPVLTLLQTFIDPADPLNFGDAYRQRPTSRTPHLVATSGLTDEYTPRVNHDAFAGAFRLPQVAPVASPIDVLELLGIAPVPAAASGLDVAADGSPLTTGLLQYPTDGHFAIYNNPTGQEAYRRFFNSLKNGEIPVAQVQ